MVDPLTCLLCCAFAGWFLLSFLLTAGNGKGWLRNLLVAAFYWLIMVDPVAIILETTDSVVRKTGIGWRFILYAVVTPYFLSLLRLGWRRQRRHRDVPRVA